MHWFEGNGTLRVKKLPHQWRAGKATGTFSTSYRRVPFSLKSNYHRCGRDTRGISNHLFRFEYHHVELPLAAISKLRGYAFLSMSKERDGNLKHVRKLAELFLIRISSAFLPVAQKHVRYTLFKVRCRCLRSADKRSPKGRIFSG